MPAKKTSIAMATFNGSEFLSEQLESYLTQTRQPGELVVSDDCSTDATAEIIETFARRASFPVRFHRNAAPLGCNRNFATAASRCSGEVILFSDQDDVWVSEHIAKLVRPFEQDAQVGLVTSDSLYVDKALNATGATLWSAEQLTSKHLRAMRAERQFPAWARHRAIAGHGMALRADLREVVLPFTDHWMYDQWMALAAVACARGVVLEDKLTLHRTHDRQLDANREQSLTQWYAAKPTLGADHFSTQVLIWTELHQRLSDHQHRLVDPRVLEVVRDRAAFLESRARMRNGGTMKRMTGAISRLLNGSYHAHGRGFLTFARDVAG